MAVPLHLQEQGFWEWASSLNSGILFIEPDLTVHLGNPLGAALLDIDYEVGRTVPLCQCLSPKSEEFQVLYDMMSSQKELRNSLLIWQTGGHIRHVVLDSYRHGGTGTPFAGMYLIAKDLGNFMIAEQHLQRNDRLVTVGKVAAGVAHEIRNPLTTIKGFVQVLQNQVARQEKADAASEQTYLNMILSEVERVEFIVSDMLMLANPRQLSKKRCDLQQLFANIRPAIDKRIESLKANVMVSCVADDVPPINADEEILTHALMNIISNALDAMVENPNRSSEVGSLTIYAYTVKDGVQIDISDTGPGIPYYQTDKIFDAFFTTKDAAVGLGLPICQRIIADHGGEIRVSSKGFGTTFHVLLPEVFYDKN